MISGSISGVKTHSFVILVMLKTALAETFHLVQFEGIEYSFYPYTAAFCLTLRENSIPFVSLLPFISNFLLVICSLFFRWCVTKCCCVLLIPGPYSGGNWTALFHFPTSLGLLETGK